MKLIVMLIATGVHGPATIAGFDTLAACNAARPKVVEFYQKAIRSYQAVTECVELAK